MDDEDRSDMSGAKAVVRLCRLLDLPIAATDSGRGNRDSENGQRRAAPVWEPKGAVFAPLAASRYHNVDFGGNAVAHDGPSRVDIVALPFGEAAVSQWVA